jgi:hypothetical protein
MIWFDPAFGMRCDDYVMWFRRKIVKVDDAYFKTSYRSHWITEENSENLRSRLQLPRPLKRQHIPRPRTEFDISRMTAGIMTENRKRQQIPWPRRIFGISRATAGTTTENRIWYLSIDSMYHDRKSNLVSRTQVKPISPGLTCGILILLVLP